MAGVLEVRGKRGLVVIPSTEEEGVDGVAFSATCSLLSHGCRLVLVGNGSALQDAFAKLPASSKSKIDDEEFKVIDANLLTSTQRSINAAVHAAWSDLGGIDFIAVGKKMQQAGTGGSFIFVTSIVGTERGLFPGVAVPGASISAVNYLTRAMALELGKHQIRVNAIARGLYESDFLLKSFSSEVLQKEGERVVPLRRWMEKDNDLTSMILYLAADASSFITGTVVFVDGGQSLVRPRMRSFL